MGVEFELKMGGLPEAMDALEHAMGTPTDILEMETTYYDTPAGDFSTRRCTLRRRLENGRSICTLKTPAAGARRNEWELECDRVEGALPELCKLSGLELPSPAIPEPICGARFRRHTWLVEFGDSRLELALDRGVLLGGGKSLPLLEAEVELKAGMEEDAEAYARILAERFSLMPLKKSKFRRALELTGRV